MTSSSAAGASATSSLDIFLDAIRDFSCLPLAAIHQQPDRVNDFLHRIGGIDVLFGALATPVDDRQVRDDIVRCFRAVLSSAPGRAALASYPSLAQALLDGLRHPDELVRQVAADQLLGLYVADDNDDDGVRRRLLAVLADDSVFDGVVKVIADPSTTVAESIAQLLVKIADPGRFFHDDRCAGLRALSAADPTVLVRVLDLAARIGNRSPDAFHRFQRSGLLDGVLAQARGDGGDVLLQMSMFTVVGVVSESDPGLRYLVQVPLGALLRRFAPGASVDAFVTCSALNLIDVIMTSSMRLHIYDWINDDDLRAFLTAAMESDDDTVLEAAIGATAAIGQSYVGLVEFTRVQHDLLLRLPRIALRPALSTNVLIVAALHGLATVFAAQYDVAEQARAESLRRAIMRGTPSDEERPEGVDITLRFMTKITKWLTNIDNDLRVATYRFLTELGRSRSGLQAILSGPGLVETLLDRRLEHDAKANLWRFSAVQALGQNPALGELGGAGGGRGGDEGLAAQIRQYIHMGPYHKGTSTDVAVL